MFLAATAAATSFCPADAAAGQLAVEGVRFGSSGEKTRIVIDFSGKPDFRAFLLENPLRLALDLPSASWTAAGAGLGAGAVKSYRSGALEKDGLTRVIFDLSKPAVVDSAFILPKEDMAKDRVVIDLRPVSRTLFRAATDRVWGNRDIAGAGARRPEDSETAAARNRDMARIEAPPARAAPKTAGRAGILQVPARGGAAQSSSRNGAAQSYARAGAAHERIYTIVIDPGHGGQDPGAESPGVREKDITLAIARQLRDALEETGRYKVVLTRDRDYYIKLRARVAISREVKADLFISIHADKIPGKSDIRGTSIYTLSQTASDAETESLAESENNAGVVAGVDLKDKSEDVADILLDLAMREKMNESNIFAQAVEQALRRKNVKLLLNSHRSAGFAVLKAPDVPAILIETGFISNPDEAKLLSSGAFQRKMGEAVVDGIDAYFRKMQALQRAQ